MNRILRKRKNYLRDLTKYYSINLDEFIVDDYVTSESESEDERTFDDQEASKDWLDNEKIWSSLKSSETGAGLRVDYRCNLVKRKGPQCAAAIYLLYKSENISVALFKIKDQHNHDEIANTGHGINKETEEYIEDLLEKGRSIKYLPNVTTALIKNIIIDLILQKKKENKNFILGKKMQLIVEPKLYSGDLITVFYEKL
ncbi:hypothetical protein BpHYR1_029440, partial [Brachionus plicatilis]